MSLFEALNIEFQHSGIFNKDWLHVVGYGPAELVQVKHVVHFPEMSL